MENPEYLLDEDFKIDKAKRNKKLKKLKIIIPIVVLIIIALIIVIILLTLPKDSKNEEKESTFQILLKDSQIHKPLSSNITTEVIKLKNGLHAILISEKNTNISSINVETPYGSSLDIIGGFAHFAEHMAFRGGNKYRENSYVKGLNYLGLSNDAFTTMESTNFYLYTKTGDEYETFIDILADTFSNPTLNPDVFKTEINNLHCEFLISNKTDDYILNNILYTLVNEKHPLHNAFSIGNNITLNSINTNDMEKYLKAYFQDVYHPKNLVVLLRANQDLKSLENLIVKHFNYDIQVTETIGNKERDEIKKKLKEERLFNKDNGGKILKFYNKISSYNLLVLSFGISNMEYKNGFNPIDFLKFLLNKTPNSSLHDYLISKGYIFLIYNKIYVQFFERETGFIHIYVLLTENGLNHIEEIIKVIFHYLNLIKNSVNELETELFPNYQKYKLNEFNYRYKENEDYNSLNRQIIINMKKHGMEYLFKNDVPDKFDKDYFFKFMEDNINIENTIISLNSNCDIEKIDLFENYTTKYLIYYGNEFNITNLSNELIESLKKYPVDDSLTNIIKLRGINEYFTNILKPNEPCYYKSNEECINNKEYNPLIDTNYKKERCDDNDKYICFFAKDRSLNIPKVQINLKLKSKSDEIFSPDNKSVFNSFCLSPIMQNYFYDFFEDYNNEFNINYDPINDEFNIVINTYKDIAKNFLIKFIDRLLKLFEEKEYNYLIESTKNNINIDIGISPLDIEKINSGAILDLFESGVTDKYPNVGYNYLQILEQFNYENYKYLHNLFIQSFINYTKLYLIGDLDDNLISELSRIIREKIPLNLVNTQENNIIKNIDESNYFIKTGNIINFNKYRKQFILTHTDLVDEKEIRFLNKYSNIISNNINQINKGTVVNYIYSNSNPFELNSYTGIFYSINITEINSYDVLYIFSLSIIEKIYTELRTKRGLGYHCLLGQVESIGKTLYLFFYVQGAMKTPIQIQDDLNIVLNEIFTTWEPENFDSIFNNYMNYYKITRAENTFSKRVKTFIDDNNIRENDFSNFNAQTNFRQIADIMKKEFENPIRIGIFEYSNYIDKNFIDKEIEERKDELYFFNKNIRVNYTYDINYLR